MLGQILMLDQVQILVSPKCLATSLKAASCKEKLCCTIKSASKLSGTKKVVMLGKAKPRNYWNEEIRSKKFF